MANDAAQSESIEPRRYWLGVGIQMLGQYLWLTGSSDPAMARRWMRLRTLWGPLGGAIFGYAEPIVSARTSHRTLTRNIFFTLSLAQGIREHRRTRRQRRPMMGPVRRANTGLFFIGHAIQMVGTRLSHSAYSSAERFATARKTEIRTRIALTLLDYLVQERPRRWGRKSSALLWILRVLALIAVISWDLRDRVHDEGSEG